MTKDQEMFKIKSFIELLKQALTVYDRSGKIRTFEKPKNLVVYEKAERKGLLHPDTLSDHLASELSRAYSLYTIKNFGFILHHNFDKVGLMGGQAKVSFGKGEITSPIRVLFNGRASDVFGNEIIPIRSLLESTASDFFSKCFPMLSYEKDFKALFEVSTGSSPGQISEYENAENKRAHWFKPRSSSDLGYLSKLVANDTSTGYSFYPLSETAQIISDIEKKLNSSEFKKLNKWIGGDIKLTGCRMDSELDITLCIPQLCEFVNSEKEYKSNLEYVREFILDFIKERQSKSNVSLNINTRDKFDRLELYLTYTGSSIENGDEGFVGRGNRVNGVIDMTRPYSMEGASGKNPVYHVGLLYSIAADRLAKRLYDAFNIPVEVSLTSQSGRLLADPWETSVAFIGEKPPMKKIEEIIISSFDDFPKITYDFLIGDLYAS